ncbi:MAG: hypothetical protein H0V96_00025 [Acidimicrobiia bacterium]|nr:hypothetical protein [Acidimicrobiia bacterium]
MSDPPGVGGQQPDPAAGEVDPGRGAAEHEEKWPVGFILTIVMVSLYLGYRLWQGLVALWHWAT